MKRLIPLFLITITLISVTGCSLFEDAEKSYNNIVEEGKEAVETVKEAKEKIEETVSDVGNALDEINEATNAIKEVTK